MKRVIDVAVSLFALIMLSMPIAVIAAMVRWRLGTPVLFRHVRPGLHGKPFELVKFRTMTGARDVQGNLLPDEQRLTPFGRFLRASSLDELPELWNILRGDMSLVGPRPLLMEYLPLYDEVQARRHDVRPGLTGLAQVNGRNSVSWEERLAIDVWYTKNHTIFLDMKIIGMTIVKVLSQDGISAPGEATMSKFTGTKGARE